MRTGYSALQVALHWTIAALVGFQLLVTEGIEAASDSDGTPTATDLLLADLHVAAGIAIFTLALFRIAVRFWRGVPPLPEDEPMPLKLAAHAVHFALYAAIVLMPITGGLTWWLDIELAAEFHRMGPNVIYALVAAHVCGALYQHFVAKTDVLRRMLRPRR